MHTDTMLGFLGGMRDGMEQGLGPLSAAQRAAGEMPQVFREALDVAAAQIDDPPSSGSSDGSDVDSDVDPELTRSLFPALEFLYDVWWRVASTGVEHVPGRGRALMVANHAGSLFPFDAAMMATAIATHHPAARWPRFLVLDWALSLPVVGTLIGQCGGVRANPANATSLLERDELVITFPEGVKGTGKPFADRYRLQPFGRGFVEVALRTGAPIVPVAVVGAEEIYPKLGESESLAKLTGAPYVPITPTFPALGPLGLIPLPSRWRIEFCEPVDVSEHPPSSAADGELVAEIAERVQGLIQRKVHENVVLRGPAFALPASLNL
jgi:1-acyl-sn-glycerol-3-phosphate acyltransferase